MEENQKNQDQQVKQIYENAANLMVEQKKSANEVKETLIKEGLDSESASNVVENIEQHMKKAKKEGANKNMLYGALWCVGGTIATVADLGYIFWGAIVFGAIQFFMGVAKSN